MPVWSAVKEKRFTRLERVGALYDSIDAAVVVRFCSAGLHALTRVVCAIRPSDQVVEAVGPGET